MAHIFIESLLNFINGQTGLSVSLAQKTENSILLRIIPGAPIDADLVEGQTWDFSFQILTKHDNQLLAYSQAEQIKDLLHGLSYATFESDSHHLIRMECTTTPNWVETNGRQQYLYTALFSAEIIKK